MVEHIDGKNVGPVMLYALSTCVWCKKTKQLMDDLGVAYDYQYVDLLKSKEREEVLAAVRRINPSCSFPTTVINGRCIVGFREAEIKAALKQ